MGTTNDYAEFGASPFINIKNEYLTARFNATSSPTDPSYFIGIAEYGTVEALQIAGDVAADIAANPAVEPEQQKYWYLRARDTWQAAIELDSTDRTRTDHAVRAAIGLITLPSVVAIHFETRIPPLTLQSQMYRELVRLGDDLLSIQQVACEENTKSTLKRVKGTLSEMSVLVLLQRFTLRGPHHDLVALPSNLSQDDWVDMRFENPLRHNWDVSEFTIDPDMLPRILHKIQVKTIRPAKDEELRYAQDIALVYVQNDLTASLEEERRGIARLEAIMVETDAELKGSATALQTRCLNRRTNRLFAAIEASKKRIVR